MSGERPVPVGNLNSSCASDRNQYLETGELNQRGVAGVSARSMPSGRKPRGERDSRMSTSAISNAGYGSNSYMEPGPSDFDDSRPWSRNGYYERDPPSMDYPYSGREHREPYYNDYGPPRRPGPPPVVDPYYRERDRSYGAPSYRHNKSEYYAPEPSYPMYNRQRGFQSPHQNSSSNQQLKAYLQEFRIRDPVRYREWYELYKEHKKYPDRIPEPLVPGYPPHSGNQHHYPPPRQPQQNGDGTRTPNHFRHPSQPSQYDERREKAVPPSGRSSRNNGSFYQPDFDDRDQFDQIRSDESEFERGFAPIDTISTTETPPDRLTPQKFITGHSIGLITPFGHLLRVAGGSRTVEVLHVKTLMKDLPEYQELDSFPGPLVRGRTHKNTVIKFCQKKIKHIQNQEFQADKDNLILLWELLILLIKQNGSVVGSDIAELLLKKKARLEVGGGAETESNNSELEDEGDDGDRDSGVSTVIVPQSPNDPKTTQRFCDRLLFGHRNDALEFAMQKGLWGHALFLASKMGDREYGQVMARFANGVAYNHPLQTLYQIMSGRVPSSMTGCMDDAFGDWRPHLAMIISNAGIRPEVEQKAFVILGDTLRNKNLIFGSQFCHLMAQSTFSEDSKLGPLLGLSQDRTNIIEATQMTEIYEYAMSLADVHFNLGAHFLHSKFDYVKSLIDFGFTLQGFSYCEVIAKQVGVLGIKNDSLRWDLIQIGERLRYADPSNNTDWIQDLKTALLEPQTTDISETSSRRGSYPASSVGISSVDQSPAAGPNVDIPPENLYSSTNNFSSNPSYPPEIGQAKVESYDQPPDPNTNNNIGAYEPNPLMYDVNQIPMLPATNVNTYNPNQNQFQNQPKTQYETNQESPWSTQTQNIQPLKQEVPSWDSNPQYFTPQPPLPGNQEPGYFQPEQKPYDLSMAGTNNNIYPPGTQFMPPPSGGMENGYPGMDYHSAQPQPPPLNQPAPRMQQSNQDMGVVPKRKTVRFEDDEGQSFRMSRSQALNILRRVESDEITETSEDDEVPKQPVQFKSTYPIDTPLGHRITPSSNASLRTTQVRTYPVDRKCCDASHPCPDHNPALSPEFSRSAGPNLNSSKKSQLEGQWKGDDKKQDGKSDGKKGSKAKANTSNTNKGGLLSWLGLRGKNQMILPDDKEPTIVWDEEKKVWKNTKEGDDDTSGPRGPPPKDSELMPGTNAPPPLQQQPGYGNPPPPQQQHHQAQQYQQSYGQPHSTVTDGPTPSFNPQLNQPVTGGQQENWGNHIPPSQPQPQQMGPASLSYNQNPPLIQSGGPQSLNLQQQQVQPPTPAPNANKYKLPMNGRGSMRGKYVDVFGGNSGGAPAQPMAPLLTPMAGNGPSPMFIPGPPPETDEFQQ